MNSYVYAEDNPVDLIDPFGLKPHCTLMGVCYQVPDSAPQGCAFFDPNCFVYYGNWGGPGWTGGQYRPLEDLTAKEQANLKPPIDAQDACDMVHDYCYSKARVKNKCTSRDHPNASQQTSYQNDISACDIANMMCQRQVNSSKDRNFHSVIQELTFSIKELID
jgi:hypothetical protein